jgi:hypothetical protein
LRTTKLDMSPIHLLCAIVCLYGGGISIVSSDSPWQSPMTLAEIKPGADRQDGPPWAIQLLPGEPTDMMDLCKKTPNNEFLSCTRVNMNLPVLMDESVLQVTMPDGSVLTRSKKNDAGENFQDGYSSAHFKSESHDASIYISYPNNEDIEEASTSISGEIVTKDGKKFSIESGMGVLIMAENNEELLEGDDQDAIIMSYLDSYRSGSYEDEALVEKGKADMTTQVEVSVIVYYTREFSEMEPNIMAFVSTCFEEMNAGLANSKIPIRMRHLGTRLYTGAENPDQTKQIYLMKDSATKDQLLNTADMACLFMGTSTGADGIAFTDTTSVPYAIVNHKSARGEFVFAHEMAHIMGAHHNTEIVPYAKRMRYPYKYSWGKRFDAKEGRHTIMTYSTQDPAFPNVANFFSGPGLFDNGVETGDAMHDNARLMTETRFRSASVGDESARIVPVNGGLSNWGRWTCDVECGTSPSQFRRRKCNNPVALDGGKFCEGALTEEKKQKCYSPKGACTCRDTVDSQNCNRWKDLGYCTDPRYSAQILGSCPETCRWCPNRDGKWQASNPCVNGKTRRVCDNPATMGNGIYCRGEVDVACGANVVSTPKTIDSSLTEWSEWKCEVECGTSPSQFRRRMCVGESKYCQGDLIEEKKGRQCLSSKGWCTCRDTVDSYNCNNWKNTYGCTHSYVAEKCPTTCGLCPNRNGGWLDSNPCLNGYKRRVCNNPETMGDGTYCSGYNYVAC